MKRSNTITYIIIGSFLAIVVVGVLFLRAYAPKYSWSENLKVKNKQPYGISVLFDLVKKSTEKENFTELKNGNFDFFLDERYNSSYIYVGSNYFVDSTNVESLIEFVIRGNKAFIASTGNIDNFLNYWLQDSSIYPVYNSITSDSISTNLKIGTSAESREFIFRHQFFKETSNYFWQYFDSSFVGYFSSDYLKVLSTIEDEKPNFIALKIGEGTLYLHSSPIFLSNYFIIKPETFPYLQSVFDEVIEGEIFWDTYSSSAYTNKAYSHLKESPLRFILKHKSFRWAWFILLVGVLLFVLIQSKRKQNTIPLIAEKKNNTLDYAKAIGSLYFQDKNHRNIAIEMMNQLYSFIKSRYGIKIGKDKDRISSKLSKLSGIKLRDLEELFKLEMQLKYNDYAESKDLFKLYSLVDQFYKKCN